MRLNFARRLSRSGALLNADEAETRHRNATQLAKATP